MLMEICITLDVEMAKKKMSLKNILIIKKD